MTTTPAPRDPALVRFGLTVRAARERAGKRQEDLAAELDITRKHMSNVETGRLRASNRLYWRIANLLELDASDASAVVREDVAS